MHWWTIKWLNTDYYLHHNLCELKFTNAENTAEDKKVLLLKCALLFQNPPNRWILSLKLVATDCLTDVPQMDEIHVLRHDMSALFISRVVLSTKTHWVNRFAFLMAQVTWFDMKSAFWSAWYWISKSAKTHMAQRNFQPISSLHLNSELKVERWSYDIVQMTF